MEVAEEGSDIGGGGVAVNQLLVGAGQRRKRWGRCRMSQRKALTLEEARVAVTQLMVGAGQRRMRWGR